MRDIIAKEAKELCASGQCAAELGPLQKAFGMGHLPSLALNAWFPIDGRQGIAKDRKQAFELAKEGARLGCQHCQVILAWAATFSRKQTGALSKR